jgi:hypothetical protein
VDSKRRDAEGESSCDWCAGDKRFQDRGGATAQQGCSLISTRRRLKLQISPTVLTVVCNRIGYQDGVRPNSSSCAYCLSLISNAVLVWNTIQIQKIVEGLRASGHQVKDEDLARVSPLLRAHVIPNGSYDLSIANAGATLRVIR